MPRDVAERPTGDPLVHPMTVRSADAAAGGACVGVGVGSLLNLLDWAARHGFGDVALPETLRLKLLGSFFRILFSGVQGVSWRGGAALVIVAALLVWRRARPIAAGACGAVAGAWIAVMACASAYALDPAIGLVPAPAALVVAALLARSRTWSVTASLILTAGILVGFFCAENLLLVRPEVTGGINPLYGFVPPVVVAVVAALLVARRKPDDPMGFARRLTLLWGVSAVGLCVTFSVALEAFRVRIRPPEPSATRVVNEFAYDVRIEGEPPAVLWTNRKRVQVLENAYGNTHRRYSLDDAAGFSERFWSSLNGGFYIQGGRNIGWWNPVPGEQPIPTRPSSSFSEPDWVPAVFVEDPLSRRNLVVSEWFSQYAVVDRDSGAVVARGVLSDAIWSWPYGTVDPSARMAFISTGMDDGQLYEFDFDSLRITRTAPNLYLYETVLDPAAGLLWGTRPFTGELLGVDTRTLEVRHRIPVEPTVRDIQRDADTGDLFTCSFLSGDVFRVDRQTLVASKIGWCGRFCRNLFLDSRHRTLWVATVDGLCRIGLSSLDASRNTHGGKVENDAS